MLTAASTAAQPGVPDIFIMICLGGGVVWLLVKAWQVLFGQDD